MLICLISSCSLQDAYLLTCLLHGAESLLRSWLVLQLVKKFPTFYGAQKFIIILMSAHHLSLSWANSIQSPQPPPIYVWVSPLVSFPQVSPPELCAHLSPPSYAPHAPSISFFSILPPAQYWVRNETVAHTGDNATEVWKWPHSSASNFKINLLAPEFGI